jgi:hypothetical protein
VETREGHGRTLWSMACNIRAATLLISTSIAEGQQRNFEGCPARTDCCRHGATEKRLGDGPLPDAPARRSMRSLNHSAGLLLCSAIVALMLVSRLGSHALSSYDHAASPELNS